LTLRSVVEASRGVFIGREKEVKLLILALIAKEHFLMVSEPGTAKTMLAETARAFGYSTSYYLLTRDTTVTDVLADTLAVREHGGREGVEKISVEYEPKGFLLSEVVIVDEVFKASSDVLNAFLGLMNERRVTLGSHTFSSPLITMIGASNEYPRDDPVLAAFSDRFLIRHFVSYIPKDLWTQYFVSYWGNHRLGRRSFEVPPSVRAELEDAQRHLFDVDVYGILSPYEQALALLEDRGIKLSDRRKARTLKLVAASALYEGRSEALEEDLEALLYTAPTSPEELPTVEKALEECVGDVIKAKREVEAFNSTLGTLLLEKDERGVLEALAKLSSVKRKLSALKGDRYRVMEAELEKAEDVLVGRLVGGIGAEEDAEMAAEEKREMVLGR